MQSLDVASPLPVTTVFDVYCLYKQQAERRAKVALLTQDTMEYLTLRFEAMRDAFSRVPGVTSVADIAPNPVSKENPDVDVVLGRGGRARGSGGCPRCLGTAASTNPSSGRSPRLVRAALLHSTPDRRSTMDMHLEVRVEALAGTAAFLEPNAQI